MFSEWNHMPCSITCLISTLLRHILTHRVHPTLTTISQLHGSPSWRSKRTAKSTVNPRMSPSEISISPVQNSDEFEGVKALISEFLRSPASPTAGLTPLSATSRASSPLTPLSDSPVTSPTQATPDEDETAALLRSEVTQTALYNDMSSAIEGEEEASVGDSLRYNRVRIAEFEEQSARTREASRKAAETDSGVEGLEHSSPGGVEPVVSQERSSNARGAQDFKPAPKQEAMPPRLRGLQAAWVSEAVLAGRVNKKVRQSPSRIHD